MLHNLFTLRLLSPDPDPQGGGDDPEKKEEQKGLTEEEVKVLVQSTASKAKNELLKEIGIEKVADIKALIEKGNKHDEINENYQTLLAEKETVDEKVKDYDELKVANSELQIENNLLKIGVETKRLERAKGIIKADIEKGTELAKAIEGLQKEFPEWISSTVVVGADIDPDNSTLTEREKYYKEMGYIK